jgi:hypothetical protein
MIESIGRRVRFTFGLGQADKDVESGRGSAAATQPLVDFVAYGEDCLFSGQLRLAGARLTDMLNAHDEVELIDVLAERLDGGSAAEVRRVLVRRDEIVAVQAAGPRGDPARRMRTVGHPLAIGMGPYVVRGLFHVPVGADPMVMIRRRPPMVPLTHATLDLEVGGLAAPPPIGTLVINRDRVEWVMSAPIET